MLISTTSTLQDKTILQYKGIVSGEVILGANIFKDFLASITDLIGGRSQSYERVLKEAKASALQELQAQAESLNANAVIGIDFDYETVGSNGSMLMVTASGTAVVVSD